MFLALPVSWFGGGAENEIKGELGATGGGLHDECIQDLPRWEMLGNGVKASWKLIPNQEDPRTRTEGCPQLDGDPFPPDSSHPHPHPIPIPTCSIPS